jgi:hypothetical protein
MFKKICRVFFFPPKGILVLAPMSNLLTVVLKSTHFFEYGVHRFKFSQNAK